MGRFGLFNLLKKKDNKDKTEEKQVEIDGMSNAFIDSNVPLAIIQNNKIVDANKKYLHILEATYDEVIGQKVGYSFTDESKLTREDFKTILEEIINGEKFAFKGDATVSSLKGNIRYVKFYASPILFDGKIAVQLMVENFTSRKLSHDRAILVDDGFRALQSLSKISMANYDGEKFHWTDHMFTTLGIQRNDENEYVNFLKDFVHEEDIEKFDKFFDEFEQGQHSTTFRVKTSHGQSKYISTQSINKRNGDKNNTYFFFEDITQQTLTEKKLRDLSDDRSLLVQEVHHRVKNNLQIILSLINLEDRFNRDNPELIIDKTKNRIRAMSLMHEKIYQSIDMSEIDIKDYIVTLISNDIALHNAGGIFLNYDLEDVDLNMSVASPLGLIINECVYNTIKHAFPDGDGTLSVYLTDKGNSAVLEIGDNGVGDYHDFDIDNPQTLGLIIIKSLTNQIQGTVYIKEQEGINYVFEFPKDLNEI